MLFRRIVSEGLAHFSYLVGHGGDAVVIDPRRDIDVYLTLAAKEGVRIRHVLETHRNEDYAIGSTALAAATGATILHSGRMQFGYGQAVRDGDSIDVGRLRLRVLETPGHTDESLSFALADTRDSDAPVLAFTGDTLFVGEVGRTDLYGPREAPRLAAALYDSLEKLFALGDGVVLCPAHGGGSVCGAGISDRELSTLGFERLHNARLGGDRGDFVERKLKERMLAAPYFRLMEEWNQQGNAPIHVRVPLPPPLSPGEVQELLDRGTRLVDTRMPQAFAGGHVPRSYNIWLDGLSAMTGWLIPVGAPMALVLPESVEIERAARVLYRMGYERVQGYLRGGFEAWQNDGREVEHTATITTPELQGRYRRDDHVVLDVREPREWEEGSIPGALQVFVGELENRLDALPRDRAVVTMCSVGHRGGAAASILARHGFRRVANYLGGMKAWKRAGLPVQ